MRKVYLSLFSIALASISFSQVTLNKNVARRAKNFVSTTDTKVKKDPILYNKAVLYSNTFNNLLDWTLSNTSNPATDWTISTNPADVFDGPFASTTVNDGFAYINSDALGQTSTQDAYITLANPIDFSANPALILSFEQYHTRYLETTEVQVSGDNGANWTIYDLNSSVATNTSTANPDLIELNISSVAGGQSQVLIRFHYVGAWDYGWAVDDIQISEALGNDIVLSKGFTNDIINAYDYSVIAGSQLQPLTVGVIANNLGGTPAVGSTLNVVINDGTSDVYNTPTTFDLAIGVTDTIWVATGFTPVTNTSYTVSFSVAADDDITNNTSTPATFETNTEVYAQDFVGTDIYRFNQDDETSMGNTFEIINNVDLPAVSVKFETGTTATVANINLWRYNPDDASFNSVQAMEFVDEIDYNIQASDIANGNYTAIPFASSITLEAGWYYVASVKKYAGADRIFIGGSAAGDDDASTVCYGPFGTGGAVNFFIGWGFAPAVRLSFVQPPVAPVVTITAGDDNILCTGGSLTLSSDMTTGNQWNLDGSVLIGETNQTLVVSAAGSYTVTNNGATSVPTLVTVQSFDVTTAIAGSQIHANATGVTYQWMENCSTTPAAITGATAQDFTPTVDGSYSVQVSANGCSQTSNCVDFFLPPTLTSDDTDNILCAAGTLTLTSSATSGNQWNLDGTPIVGETNATLVVTAAGSYTVTVGGLTSSAQVVTAQTIDVAVTAFFSTLSVAPQAGATYQWGTCNPIGIVAGETAADFTATTNGDYSVAVTINGCTAISACTTISNAGINENAAFSSFSVYPNPAAENVAIDYALKNESKVNVSISDLSGKVVYTSNLGSKTAGSHNLSVNTTSFANGIYVVNFTTTNGIITEKLVIRK
ncbi:MAG: T9SS type A sorting domain-containing protein [Bacteroidota bacterium]